MDHSFALLCSMSPKITKKCYPLAQKKVPTTLALKRNIRHSSSFNHICPSTNLRPSVVNVDSNSESSGKSDEIILNNEPIIIFDSDENDSESKIQAEPFLSPSKLFTIKDWIDKVNVEQITSTEQKTVNINTSPNPLDNLNTLLSTLNKVIEDDINNQPLDSSSDSESSISSTIQILDELYSDSWKHLQSDLLPKSTPQKIIRNRISNNCSKTDVKSNLFANKFKEPASPWTECLKVFRHSDSYNDLTDNSKTQVRQKLNFNSDINSSDLSKKYSNDSTSDLSEKRKIRVKPKQLEHFPKTDGDNGKTTNKIPANQTEKKNKDKSDNESKRLPSYLNVQAIGIGSKKEGRVKEKLIASVTKNFLESLSGSVPVSQCDSSARLFRNNFKKYKDELLKILFELYNKNIFDNKIPSDTLFEWNDRMRGTAGFCYCRKVTRRTGMIERKVRIVFSTKVVDSCDRLRDTLIHELCHAATWIVNEVANGHGDFWRIWAAKSVERFPELPPIKRCHDYIINTKYTYRCKDCGYSIGRHSKSLDIDKKRCGYCYGKFEVLLNKINKCGEMKSVPVVYKKPPTSFALFVKEHYATYKTPELKHGQVMKLLGQKFNQVKVSS